MKVNRYIAWDRTVFENKEKGIEYDKKAWVSVCDEIYFFFPNEEKCIKTEYFDFINIPKENYKEDFIDNLTIFHTDSIEILFIYFLFSPVVYCHTDEAAAILNGIVNLDNSFKGIRKGFLFYDDNNVSYLTVNELDKTLVASSEFEKVFNIMRNFIRGNV